MKGKYYITVQNKKLRYELEVKRNITIIRGDSATGKTTLIEMLESARSIRKVENHNTKPFSIPVLAILKYGF